YAEWKIFYVGVTVTFVRTRQPQAQPSRVCGWGCSRGASCACRQGCLATLRDAVDRLQNARDDLVGIAFRVRAAIFQIAPVTVLDEVNRHPDGSAPIGETIAELVNGLGFVQTRQAQMITRAIHGDVPGDVGGERFHKVFKVFLATYFAEVLKREITVHAGAIPVTFDGFAVQFNVDCVFLTETHQQIASGPGVIGGFGGAFGEDLEFPLTFGDFRVDAFMIDTGRKTQVPVFFDDLAGQAAHVLVADTAVVGALGSTGVAVFREAERTPILIEKVFLLQTNP